MSFIRQTRYAGGYRMGLFSFNLHDKPSAWHRFWVRVTLGWVWEDLPCKPRVRT